jgi:hypothetical protein
MSEPEAMTGPAVGAGAGSRRAHVSDGLILALACVAQFMGVLDSTTAGFLANRPTQSPEVILP